MYLAIKPDYISLESIPDSLRMRVKLEFVEQKTDYQAVYFSIPGVDNYFALKIANEDTLSINQDVDIYLPYRYIKIYDKDHNRVNSREVVYQNIGTAVVKNEKGNMVVNVAGAKLVYPQEDGIQDGTYDIIFKQEGLLPVFNRKMLKSGHTNPEMDNPKNVIKVSAYDEDVLGTKLLAYVQINGFENYASFVMDNNFSVYKMPKFSLYVPREGFILKPKQ